MAYMLTDLPREVFILIIDKLTKTDLKRLSQASRWLHQSVANSLWKCITIEPLSEYHLGRVWVPGLPQSCLRHATQLQFRSDFQFSVRRRCPHAEGLDSSMHFDDGHDEDEELQDQPRFYASAQKIESLIRRFEPGQLQSFSWDLGTCLLPEIFGVNGVVPLQQSSLQSLSSITDPTCRACYDGECEIDLSPFSSLESLSWIGPTSDNLHALTVALQNNSTHLRNLKLDFLNWHELREYLAYFSDDADEMTSYFADVVLGLSTTLKRFVGHQRMINTNEDSPHFERPCDVSNLGIFGHSMRRIKEDPSQNPLGKLDLEFIGLPCIPKRLKYILFPFTSKTSLKVLHIRQSASDLEQCASWAINEDPALATSTTRSDTSSESGQSLPWTDSGPLTPNVAAGDVSFGPNAVKVAANNEGGCLWPPLHHEFRQFLEWAFGPQGIASLDIVAFGDFAHGGQETTYNLLLSRSNDAMSNFRILDPYGRECEEFRDKYRDAMEACPVEPLFRF